MSDVNIAVGYCFETDAREPAIYAVQKRDAANQNHHYFCISKDCALRLKQAHFHETGVAWFRSDPSSPEPKHITTCEYGGLNGAGSSLRKDQSRYAPDETQRIVIPNFLGAVVLQKLRAYPNYAPPSRHQIAAMAAKAKLLTIPGDLEEVVNARESVKKVGSEYPLTINGHDVNYQSAFPWIWDMPQPWKPDDWQKSIVTAYCKVNKGTHRSGIWFVNVTQSLKGKYAGSGLKLSLMIHADDLQHDTKKKQYEAFLEAAAITGQTVKLYWQGGSPDEVERGYRLTGPRPLASRFALRGLNP